MSKIIGITVGTTTNPDKFSGATDEQVQKAVDNYLDKNSVEVETADEIKVDDEGNLTNGNKIASIKALFDTVDFMAEEFGNELENKADKSYVDEKLENVTGGTGGINETAKALLISILKAGLYTTDQSSNIMALEAALNESGAGSGGEVTVLQVGTSLILSGVSSISNIMQNGTTLVLS